MTSRRGFRVRVTLSDVAQCAGVSIKTVSRVVNRESDVSDATRARVLRAITELGYRPNVLARGLVQQRSRTIVIVSYGLDRYGPSRFVMGVQTTAEELGYALLLTLLQPATGDKADAILDDLLSRQVDGIIWQAPNVADTQRWIRPDRLIHLPPVVINSLPNPNVTTVSIDNYYGACLAVEHLLEQGWQRIGFLSGPPGYPMTSERQRGWRESLQRRGIAPDPELVAHAEWTPQGGATAMQALLTARPDVDAVFAYNDAMAIGAFAAARRRGRRIGQDLGLIGFNDAPEALCTDPPLSTVHQDTFALGQEAVHALVRLIETKASGAPLPPPVLISSRPTLVVRESSLRRPVAMTPVLATVSSSRVDL
jgi:DNA-binding LacI/PurR family transcriptional regulator